MSGSSTALASGMSPSASHDNGTCAFRWDGTKWEFIHDGSKPGFSCGSAQKDVAALSTATTGWIVIGNAS